MAPPRGGGRDTTHVQLKCLNFITNQLRAENELEHGHGLELGLGSRNAGHGLELETGDGLELGHELARIRRKDFGHGLELGDGLEPGHDPSEATTFCGSV